MLFASLSAHCDADCQKRREDALALLKLRNNSPILFAKFRQSFEMIGDDQRRNSAEDDSGESPSAAGANSSAFEWPGLF